MILMMLEIGTPREVFLILPFILYDFANILKDACLHGKVRMPNT